VAVKHGQEAFAVRRIAGLDHPPGLAPARIADSLNNFKSLAFVDGH
jgi:hypothetical protein